MFCSSQKAYLSVILVDGLFVMLIDKGNYMLEGMVVMHKRCKSPHDTSAQTCCGVDATRCSGGFAKFDFWC